MKHKFQDPYFKTLAERLVKLDTDAQPRPRLQTVKAYFRDHGIDLDRSAKDVLVDRAQREAARRGMPEATYHKKTVFHPAVLKHLRGLVTPNRV